MEHEFNKESEELPPVLNIGSGKDFRNNMLNIDISREWNPDIVADISKITLDAPYRSDRFGVVRFNKFQFKDIHANDVLEHIVDIIPAMKNILDLLAIGGTLTAKVPYELGTGAWSDPTHVRAFNERSWIYYTDWFWYLNWTEYRFKMKDLVLQYSELGNAYYQSKINQVPKTDENYKEVDIAIRKEVIRQPRMVEAMTVVMEKIELTELDKENLGKSKRRNK